MRQIQVKAGPRIRHIALADPPTVNRKIARRWFFQITADLCVQTI
jgi:hypothetical protein